MAAQNHPDRAPGETGPPTPRRPAGPLLFLLVVSAVVMSAAVLVAVWMYWLGGVLPA